MMDYRPLRSKAPPHSILNPQFVYRSAAQTDIRATFKRIREKVATIHVASLPLVVEANSVYYVRWPEE